MSNSFTQPDGLASESFQYTARGSDTETGLYYDRGRYDDPNIGRQQEQRQKLAEGLYQGIASYLQNMNSMTVNLPGKIGPGRPNSGAAAAVEQSRNQR